MIKIRLTEDDYKILKQIDFSEAKDEYFYIVTKILIHLYKNYKQIDMSDFYIEFLTKKLSIREKQISNTVEITIEDGMYDPLFLENFLLKIT